MKKVLSISVNGKFHQYLLKSETRFINNLCEDFGKVTVEVVEITKAYYKSQFGK